jgi:hypothetical protein
MRAIVAHLSDQFSLNLYHLVSSGDNIVGSIPVINGWVQIELQVKRTPNPSEETAFFHKLAALRDIVAERGYLSAWYFLHKPPGLKLRLRIDRDEGGGLNCILNELSTWEWTWLGRIDFGSFFDQHELLSGLHRVDIDRLLTISADAYLDSISSRLEIDRTGWATFAVGFLGTFIADAWLVWEALGRFLRMRVKGVAPNGDASDAFADPRLILARINGIRPLKPGFEASVSLLQCLNYIFNMWAIDAASQLRILEQARDLVRPNFTIR